MRESVGSILPEPCFKKEGDPFKGLLKDFACISCGIQPNYVVMQALDTPTPIGAEIRAERLAEAAVVPDADADSAEPAADTSADTSSDAVVVDENIDDSGAGRRLETSFELDPSQYLYTIKLCPEFAKKMYNRGKDEFATVDLDKAPEAFDECGYIHLT